MITAVVVFLTAGQPIMSMRAAVTFDTLDACRAFIEREEPRLHLVAAEASAQTGRPVTFATRCVDTRPDA